MAKEVKKALVPKLRFPGFRDAWDKKALAPYLEECGSRVPATTSLPIYSSSRSGLTPQASYYDGRTIINDGEYGVVPPNCFVYRHMSDDGQFAFNVNETGGEIAVSKEYPVFRTINLDSRFLRAKLNHSQDFKAFALSQKAGGTRTRLYFSKLGSWETYLPSLAEQQKIADCLSSLDELIAAQGRKIEALKTYKRGLMQQLFPREGETLPRLRFPEFRDAPEWTDKKLSAVIDLVSGLHLSPDEYSVSGEVPYFTGPSDFSNDVQCATKWTKASANIAREHDTLITVKGSGVGEVWYLELPLVAMGRQLMAVRAHHNCSSRFIFQVLLTKRSRFEDLAAGNLIPGLARGDILNLVTPIPEEDEQRRIAGCLSSLDDQIAVESQQLDALKNHKKGLMQQLFPSLEAVEA